MTQRDTLFDVHGMSCGSCVRHVTSALAAVPGVSKVDVQLKTGIARVQHDVDAPVAGITEALREAGYESSVRAVSAAAGPAVHAPRDGGTMRLGLRDARVK
jgi:copper chaperone